MTFVYLCDSDDEVVSSTVEQKIEVSSQIPRIWLAPLSLGQKRHEILRGTIERLGGKFSTDQANATHVVSAETVPRERVSKLLQQSASASSLTLVTCEWIIQSSIRGNWLDHLPLGDRWINRFYSIAVYPPPLTS